MLNNTENFNISEGSVNQVNILTKAWKNGELRSGWYWVKVKDFKIEPDFYSYDDNNWLCNCDKEFKPFEVIARCDYDHFSKLKCEIEDLSSKNKHLLNLQANQDKEIESLRDKNNQLRNLLKECKGFLSDVDTYFTKNADEAALLLTRINKVLK